MDKDMEQFQSDLLESVRQMQAGRAAWITRVEVPPIVAVRNASGLSQAEFAALLGVSKRTLQEWEQGRRTPSGAAMTLILIAQRRPDVLREVLKEKGTDSCAPGKPGRLESPDRRSGVKLREGPSG